MAVSGRIPLMLLPMSSMQRYGSQFKGLGVRLLGFYPSLRYDLRNIGYDVQVEYYCVISFFSAMVWAVLLSLFFALLLSISPTLPLQVKALVPILAFVSIFMFFIGFYFAYPGVVSKNIGAAIDHELIFVMRDMLIQISSGIPLFTVLENIGNANYDYVSKEMKSLVTKVKGGSALIDELENMAIRTQSEYLKKTTWQMVTAIRAGADLTSTLKSIVKMLVDYQFSLSKSFNAELNFIILIYLMVSAVLPTIGTTVMVIFSVFGLLGVSPELLTTVVMVGFIAQFAIIWYVHLKRPNLYM
jgi:pilus assembly protein TadC